MSLRTRTLISGVAVAALALTPALAGCSSSSTASGGASASSAAATSTPDLEGVWTGTNRFAVEDGNAVDSSEKLTITKQEGPLLWGESEYPGPNGEMRTSTFTGTLTDGGSGVVLTERAGFFEGTVDGDTMSLTFIGAKGPGHTAFEVTLTKQ